MATRMGSGHGAGINEINITPFVDVVLVLLIIFMVATPAMVYEGLKVQLPHLAKPEEMAHVTLRLMIGSDSKWYLDQKPINQAGLTKALKHLRKYKAVTDATVAADNKVAHGEVMALCNFLRQEGVEEIGFLTQGGKLSTTASKPTPPSPLQAE